MSYFVGFTTTCLLSHACKGEQNITKNLKLECGFTKHLNSCFWWCDLMHLVKVVGTTRVFFYCLISVKGAILVC